MPEMARKIGKIMAEFRNTTNEFKETWQREANFEEEAKAFDLKTLEAETVNRVEPEAGNKIAETNDAPAIKEIDAASFEHLKTAETEPAAKVEKAAISDDINDKKNWL
jgi:Sec-independent protein translocase protein TatA